MSSVSKKLVKNIYSHPPDLNRTLCKKYIKKFCKHYACAIKRNKKDEEECIVCYNKSKKFISIPCCCEQLICYSCFKTLIDYNQFKCMICRKKVDFEDTILSNTFEHIRLNPKINKKLVKRRIRKINSYFFKRKWKLQRKIVLTNILEKMKQQEFDIFQIKKIKFINIYSVKVTFFTGEIIFFTLSHHDNEL